MQRSRIIAGAVAVSLVLGATIYMWHERANLFGSFQRKVAQEGAAANSGSSSTNEFERQIPSLFRDRILSLLDSNGRDQLDGETVVQSPIDDKLAPPPVEPSPFNVDAVAVGPRAAQIAVDPSLLDPAREEGLADSDSKEMAPSTAVNALGEDVAHNEQILQGKATTPDLSIGPKEVDPDSHPPTD